MARFDDWTPRSSAGPMAIAMTVALVAIAGVYAWVFYVTQQVTLLTDLVHGTHTDDSRQDVQISADKVTLQAQRQRLDDIQDRMEDVEREQQYFRDHGRATTKSLGILNERVSALVNRQQRVIDTIEQLRDMDMPPAPTIENFLPDLRVR